jgi:hypothetical protein
MMQCQNAGVGITAEAMSVPASCRQSAPKLAGVVPGVAVPERTLNRFLSGILIKSSPFLNKYLNISY